MYANRSDLGIGQFYHIELKAPYSPDHYKEAVDAAVKTVGPEGVVIVDSLSHAWSNAGGVLEIKAGIAAQPGKNSYTAWDEAGRIQNDFINYLLSVNCHTICTLRVKQDYVLTENDRGKQVPVKVGLAPVQRDDVEYEFDIMFNIGRDHIAATSKDVTFLDGFNAVITPELGRQLAAWADEGKEPVRCEECGSLVAATGKMTIEQLAGYTREHYGKCLCSACAVKAERARRAAERRNRRPPMKPSDDRVRRKKDKLQQARNARGKVWQDDLLESLCGIPGAWARQWPADWAGQPYDIEATIEGRSRGIECKHIAKGNLPFSAFRPNEVENLSRKEDAGGIAVVAVRRDSPAVDCFFPWYYIRDRIESGERGSVKLEGLPTELQAVLEVVHP